VDLSASFMVVDTLRKSLQTSSASICNLKTVFWATCG